MGRYIDGGGDSAVWSRVGHREIFPVRRIDQNMSCVLAFILGAWAMYGFFMVVAEILKNDDEED